MRLSIKTVVMVSLIGAVLLFHAHGRSASGIGKTTLILNEDDSHFFGSRSVEQMNMAGLNAFVDQYANTAVSHLFLCPNAMKASYRSKVREAIWELKDGQKPPQEEFAKKWCENARLLDERGLDPYAVWIARCREKQISPWLSMRMNDVHNVNDVDNYIHSSFWRDHPDYWRVPGGGGWTDRALDYGIPEVREHAMAFFRELLERYDPDGIELDWMRFGYHFSPTYPCFPKSPVSSSTNAPRTRSTTVTTRFISSNYQANRNRKSSGWNCGLFRDELQCPAASDPISNRRTPPCSISACLIQFRSSGMSFNHTFCA